jgi:hypothetical protein
MRAENDGGYRVFATAYLQQMSGEAHRACAEFEDGLARDEMHNMTRRLGTPQEPVFPERIPREIIIFPELFP